MKKSNTSLPVLLLGLSLLAPAAQAALPLATDSGQELPSLAPMLERVRPAVVNIATTGKVRIQQSPLLQDPFFRRFFDIPEDMPRERRTQSLGSGVIIDAGNGYVITNNHVIEKADEITVTLQTGRELSATLVGADPETDIAVLKVKTDGIKLTELALGDSSKLRVGDFVVAVGNPFGLGQTATSGIVSALERTGLGIEGYESFIQTDASINPGNSGGALVNLRGELIGVNTAILAPSGGNVGIGFAIPVNMVREVMGQIIKYGEVQRGQLGISIQDLTPALAEAMNTSTKEGVVIAQVLPGSAAEKAGLKAGDVVISINDKPVRSAAQLRNRVGLIRVGEKIEMTVLRDGKQRTVTAVVQSRSESQAAVSDISPRLEGAEFSETQVQEGGTARQRVAIAEVQPDSPAAAAGLRQGDIILSVNQRPVNNLNEFRQAVRNTQGRLLLHIRRGNGAFYLVLQ